MAERDLKVRMFSGTVDTWRYCGGCGKPLGLTAEGWPNGTWVQVGQLVVSVLCAPCAEKARKRGK